MTKSDLTEKFVFDPRNTKNGINGDTSKSDEYHIPLLMLFGFHSFDPLSTGGFYNSYTSFLSELVLYDFFKLCMNLA